MPQVGWFELITIVIIAILVIGPKDFPVVLNKVGSWIRTFKSYFSDVQRNINEITNLDDKEKKDNQVEEGQDKNNER
ncbi:MAG: sec-independent protein translocase protein TatB [Pelagibacterales bacterium]|nr:sec-independent protein translocase protein TatB [Pelagibacterales bacterium]